ncbi:hypothetical protein F4W67_12770 [Pseudomonas caricapapayae]|nr:hypothetical protein F4W67_12770 [Pseudomonas caricapapayae]
MSAKGCEAALRQVISVAPDVPYASVLLPVPGSSRTSPLLRPARSWTSEYGISDDTCSVTLQALSRTRPLPRLSARIKSRLVYNAGCYARYIPITDEHWSPAGDAGQRTAESVCGGGPDGSAADWPDATRAF